MVDRRKNHSIELEQKIFRAVVEYHERCGYAPSIREICKAVGIDSTSHVKYYLDRLTEKGLIERAPRQSRAIKPPKAFNGAVKGMVRCPIVSVIQAGEPIHIPDSDFSHFDPDSYVDVSERMLPKNNQDLFALQVQGDSMKDAYIADGDLVVIRKTEVVKNGDMVAAWIPSESTTTLKYYFLEQGKVRLQPANKDYQPIIRDPNDVEVKGVVVHVMRSMS